MSSLLLETSSRSRLILENDKNSPDETFERSAALERVYVHEVYENFGDYNTGSASTARSYNNRVVQFLNNLEPGSIVCDVGCGNGHYLSSLNSSIFALGVERSFRLAKAAKNSSVEMALCDNLELPFRDESFDAVLSLSVIHHFATAERRISAIRELARVLKVGGKIVISVWAFEQKSRRFDGNSSQDVLIPWQPSQLKNTTASDEDDEDEFLAPYHAYSYNEDSIHSNSSRSIGDGDSSSISSSSSPNDTCYSFVRRALQKLAGGKRSPWFLDSWTSRDIQKEGSLEMRDEDAKDLPIELRKLDDDYDYSSTGMKSRSLGSILYPPQKQIVRSLSSVPSLGGSAARHVENTCENAPKESLLNQSTKKSCRPKLMKQKQSISDENHEDLIKNFCHHVDYCEDIKSQFLRKQNSLNEELMAENRIREKERIRKKIQKQVSLNETFLYRSLLTKRLQVIREGFTTKFKKSSGSLERLTKNGFVKIIKTIKVGNTSSNLDSDSNISSSESREPIIIREKHLIKKSSQEFMNEKIPKSGFPREDFGSKIRRPSESDSSKENSLQSDTSVESEDSFASVIHNPTLMPTSPPSHTHFLSVQSPTSHKNSQTDSFTFDVVDKEKNETYLGKTTGKCIFSTNDDKPLKLSTVKNLAEIPKFNRKSTNFPLVKRLPSSTSSSGKNVIVPKLKSLEIFNPEIDDSSSDSSCDEDDDDSTPDSVDSVIAISTNIENVLQSESLLENGCETKSSIQVADISQTEEASDLSPPLSAKIQSQKNILNLTGTSKRQYQFQSQTQKMNDFILEENEDTEEEIRQPQEAVDQVTFKNNFEITQIEHMNDTTCLLQESFEESDTPVPIRSSILKTLKPNPIRFNSNDSCSQDNSNSTTASLDSPSIGGGSATHHIFHHIFRQNELDDLINKHVGNLHIVSSFYEKQSWCVVCEKVQVWTI